MAQVGGKHRVRTPSSRATGQQLRHLVEHAHDLIYCCDANGHFTYMNPAMARVMRLEPGEILGQHVGVLIRPDHRETVSAEYARQVADAIPEMYLEFPAVTRPRETIWIGQHVQLVPEKGVTSGIEAIASDIARAEAPQARDRNIVADSGRCADHRSTLAEESSTQRRSRDARLRVGRRGDGAEHCDVPSVARGLGRLCQPRPRASVRRAEWKRKRRDADQRLADGPPRRFPRIRLEGIVQDITERHALEAQLRQAQKMDAVGILARAIAHDFNNVLAAIMGCSDLLMLRLPAGDASREDAAEIGRAADRGAALTRQLLAFSRRQPSDPHPTDLAAQVVGLRQLLQETAGHTIALDMRTPVDASSSASSAVRSNRSS